jgi:hypothetical protein
LSKELLQLVFGTPGLADVSREGEECIQQKRPKKSMWMWVSPFPE